jgi:hypothetical protein
MISCCSEGKVLAALLTLVNHKNAVIRARTAVWVDRCVAQMGNRVCARSLAWSPHAWLPCCYSRRFGSVDVLIYPFSFFCA